MLQIILDHLRLGNILRDAETSAHQSLRVGDVVTGIYLHRMIALMSKIISRLSSKLYGFGVRTQRLRRVPENTWMQLAGSN